MFSRILLPLAPYTGAAQAKSVETALKLAVPVGADLHLLSVISGCSTPLVLSGFQQAAIQRATADAEQRLAQLMSERLPAAINGSASVQLGSPVGQILRHARRIAAELIILAAADDPGADPDAGSVIARVVRRARCSVIVVREDPQSCPDHHDNSMPALSVGGF